MRGEKTLEFPFAIRFSENGSFAESSRITLRAPGLGKRHVHFEMTRFIMKAVSALEARRKTMLKDAEPSAPPLDEDAEQVEAKEQDPLGIMYMMASGLGDEYKAFCDYVMGALTGSPKLASIGDNGTALVTETWEAIDAEAGMDGIDRVLGAFTAFFFGSPPSTSATGAAKSPTSSSATKAASPTSMPRASRLKS